MSEQIHDIVHLQLSISLSVQVFVLDLRKWEATNLDGNILLWGVNGVARFSWHLTPSDAPLSLALHRYCSCWTFKVMTLRVMIIKVVNLKVICSALYQLPAQWCSVLWHLRGLRSVMGLWPWPSVALWWMEERKEDEPHWWKIQCGYVSC